MDRSLADNYTCAVRNPWGEERATWEVRALAPPQRPQLRLAAAAGARLHLTWAEPEHAPGTSIHSELLGCSQPLFLGRRAARSCLGLLLRWGQVSVILGLTEPRLKFDWGAGRSYFVRLLLSVWVFVSYVCNRSIKNIV